MPHNITVVFQLCGFCMARNAFALVKKASKRELEEKEDTGKAPSET